MKIFFLSLSFCVFTFIGLSKNLPQIPQEQLLQDFEILTKALEETHTGLYWYTSKEEYNMLKEQISKGLKKDSALSELEFYHRIAPLITLTREDHCDISLSQKTAQDLHKNGKYFPYLIKFIDQKAYLFNHKNPSGKDLNGYELLEINGKSVKTIIDQLFNTFASDGYILSSKYRWLDDVGFSNHYATTINSSPEKFTLLVRKNATSSPTTSEVVPTTARKLAIDFEKFKRSSTTKSDYPAELKIQQDYALLILETFSNSDYEKKHGSFGKFIDNCFYQIKKSGVQNLIIDVRANGGGNEGNEDYLFSYLTNKPYSKYSYVESNTISCSYFQHTDYASEKEKQEFEQTMKEEYELHPVTGKYRRKKSIEKPTPPQENPFMGNLFILAGGVTYSGGAEFCSLVKHNRKAIFIGEEVGGGYYGNTSGYSFTLTLPNSKITVEVPIIRFVLDVDGQKLGTGTLPDFPIQPNINDFLNGIDTELNFTIGLIRKN